MALMVKPDGTRTPIVGEGENGEVTLQQLYKLIGCRWVEHVACDPAMAAGFDGCYIDEEGKFNQELRKNAVATEMCTWIAADDVIVGTAVFVNINADGDSM